MIQHDTSITAVLHYIRTTIQLVKTAFVFIAGGFVFKYFLLNFSSIKRKCFNWKINPNNVLLKKINYMIKLIFWRLKREEILLFSYLVNFCLILEIKSARPDSKIKFLMICLPHNDISFLLQLYKKSYSPPTFMSNMYFR